MDLISSGGGDDGLAHCARCGALAAGPCARCRLPMCGDCVVLTEGGAGLWAICRECARRGGRSLRAGWAAALFWILLPMAVLWGVAEVLERVFR